MATLARPIARRRGVPLTSSLRSSLRRLPLVQFELPVVRKRLDAALAEAGPAAPPSLVGALHTAAVVSCAERQRWDLLAPLLRAAASDRSHGAGAYTAALDAIARAGPAGASSCEVGGEAGGGEEEGGTTASRRLALSRGVADDMRAAGHSPSRLALHHLLWSARGAGEDPMELLLHEMRRGLRPTAATLNAVLTTSASNAREARRRAAHESWADSIAGGGGGGGGRGGGGCGGGGGLEEEQQQPPAALSARLLLDAFATMGLRPNGASLQQLLEIADSRHEVEAVASLLPPPRRGPAGSSLLHSLLLARVRVGAERHNPAPRDRKKKDTTPGPETARTGSRERTDRQRSMRQTGNAESHGRRGTL